MRAKDMKPKYIFSALLGLSLLFTACKQDEVLSTTESNQEEYITLELGLEGGGVITSEEEDSRALMYLGAANKPTIFFGKDGDKVKVQTNLYKGLADGTFKTIFTQPLEWTVTNDGTRLIYKGGISILRGLLQDAKTYHIVAMLGERNEQSFRHSGFYHMSRSGKIKPADLNVPMLLQADLVRQGVEGRTVVNKDISRSKFIPRGHLILLSVTNSSSQPVTPFQVRHNQVRGNIATSYFIGLPPDGEKTLLPRFNYVPERTNYFTSGIGRTRRYVFRGVEEVAIAPGTTERFVSFIPTYFGDTDPKLLIIFNNAPEVWDKVVDRIVPVKGEHYAEQQKGMLLRYDVEVIP